MTRLEPEPPPEPGAHEAFERLWVSGAGEDEDLFKGLIQAAICLHHFQRGELDGAAKLHSGARRLLAPFLPVRRGLDLARFLGELQTCLRPVLRRAPEERVPFDEAARPRLGSPASS